MRWPRSSRTEKPFLNNAVVLLLEYDSIDGVLTDGSAAEVILLPASVNFFLNFYARRAGVCPYFHPRFANALHIERAADAIVEGRVRGIHLHGGELKRRQSKPPAGRCKTMVVRIGQKKALGLPGRNNRTVNAFGAAGADAR